MKYLRTILFAGMLGAGGWGLYVVFDSRAGTDRVSDHEVEFEGELESEYHGTLPATPGVPEGVVSSTATSLPAIAEPIGDNGRTRWAAYWEDMTPLEYAVYGPRERPDGPPRVGVQVGHWQRDNLPLELQGLTSSTGALAGGFTETEVNLAVARALVEQLEAVGVVVDLLPVTVPVDYVADAFVSIHADGSSNAAASGYKFAGPRRDFSGKADRLVAALYNSYGTFVPLPRDDDGVTRRMSGYYAFNWRRYDHAVHPQTPAVIVEMGFLTNTTDRRFITSQPETVARGIADGVVNFLRSERLLP